MSQRVAQQIENLILNAWNQMRSENSMGVCALCDECGGSSASFCECAKTRFRRKMLENPDQIPGYSDLVHVPERKVESDPDAELLSKAVQRVSYDKDRVRQQEQERKINDLLKLQTEARARVEEINKQLQALGQRPAKSTNSGFIGGFSKHIGGLGMSGK